MIVRLPYSLLVLVLLSLSFATKAAPTGLMTLDQAGTGNLLVTSTTPGQYVPAPALGTDVQMTITGTINRTIVTQKFQNPTDQWIEATYAFPLPEGASVDGLKMVIGERLIEGQIKEKEDARRTYENAKATGKKASLVEQQRPNLFTNEVANIGPYETIIVQIEYQENVRVADGTWSIRFPMVVGTRFNPPAGNPLEEPGENRHEFKDPVPNRDKIPTKYDKGRVNPLTLSVNLNAGMALQSIETPFHRTNVTQASNGRHKITLAKDVTMANRDFELIWTPKVGAAPAVSTYIENVGGEKYALITMTPPQATPELKIARELVLVIDVSGSMAGTSITQAKASALSALSRLKPEDSINVIIFSNETISLFLDAQPLTPAIRRRAQNFISALSAGGGTFIYPALSAALTTPNEEDSARLRQIVFMTDGSVGNEDELFRLINDKLGNSRLFTVGIGSAPNSHFMTRAAAMGRGTFTYIGGVGQVEERMKSLFNKLESPAMTDITVTWPSGSNADMAQGAVPDLYAGEPIILAAKLSQVRGSITVAGTVNGELWQQKVKLSKALSGDGISKLWARHKIAAISESGLRTSDREKTRAMITSLALSHHIVSKYTSLVAVDVTPAREEGTPLTSKEVPLMIPEGWTMFDRPEELQAYTPSIMAKIKPQSLPTAAPLVLPQGATGIAENLLFGMLLLLGGLVFWLSSRRQRPAFHRTSL